MGEYIPSRVRKASGPALDRFAAPAVQNAHIASFDADGLGDETNNRTAIGSMTGYRASRYGRHVDLIMTDLHSYTMQDPTARSEAATFDLAGFPLLLPQEALDILDAGRAYANERPPDSIALGNAQVPNFRKDEPPFTVLGRTQKAWLKSQLKASTATWKIWAATNGTLDIADGSAKPAG